VAVRVPDLEDPEAKRLLAERVVEHGSPALARNGGRLMRHLGAELVVIFGVPELHEDDALRAAQAACDLRQHLAEVSEVHVGISSGEVVVTGLEVIGAPVEAALSLAAQAAGSEIRLDDETRQLAGVLAYLGRLDEARTLDGELRREHAERGGTLLLGAWASQESARLELLAGNPAAAAALAEEGCQLLEQAGARSLLSTGVCYLAQALYALDRLDEAQACATKAAELGGSDDVVTQILSRRVRAKVLARGGSHGEAEVVAREAIAMADATEAPIHQADAYADLAEVLELAGRPTEATAALRVALERYERKEALVPAQYIRTRLTALQLELRSARSVGVRRLRRTW
jgi:tetratricopeptide (TPR) repeat protein